jgi:flagellar biosynthesis protein FliR
MTLSHFSCVILFALCTSVVFGITQRTQPKMMIRFGAYCFALFVGGVIVASWLMFAIKH